MKADNFTFRLPEDLRKVLEKQAKKEDRSVAYIINRYLRKGLVASGYLQSESADE